MKILVNMTSTVKDENNKFHGGNEYANVVVKEVLHRICGQSEKTIYLYYDSMDQCEKGIISHVDSTSNAKFLISSKHGNLNSILGKYDVDRFYEPMGTPLLSELNLESIETIFTIHGLRGIEMPTELSEYYLRSRKYFLLKKLFEKIYKKRNFKYFSESLKFKCKKKTLVVVSNHSKYAILNHFGNVVESIKVFYSPCKCSPMIDEKSEIDILKKFAFITPKEYFLVISAKRWVKNTYRVIRAFDELIDNGYLEGKKIVFTGSSDKLRRLIRNRAYFITLDYIQAEELEVLYKNAYAFIYPSLNEGFGYPPLEAMKYSTPVIASMISSIPEVVGSAAIGFNPFSIDELQNRILQLLAEKEIYKKLEEEGLKRYAYMSKRQSNDLTTLVELILE